MLKHNSYPVVWETKRGKKEVGAFSVFSRFHLYNTRLKNVGSVRYGHRSLAGLSSAAGTGPIQLGMG